MSNTPVALVTGASSGIGREAALALHQRGVTVFGAARRAMPDLEEQGIQTLQIDVTSDESLRAGLDRLLAASGGRLDILVNNAGYGQYGSIEDTPLAEARRQFDVNVFGAMRLTQLALPHLMADLPGRDPRFSRRIINISSMGGLFSMALGGWYHATKYATEALSDALRQEVRGFGVDVVLIEPGLIHTGWPQIAADNLRTSSGFGKYATIAKGFAAALDLASAGQLGSNPQVIGQIVAQAATCARPRTRYRRGMGAVVLTTLTPLVPDRLFDAGVRWFLSHLDAWIGYLRDQAANPAGDNVGQPVS